MSNRTLLLIAAVVIVVGLGSLLVFNSVRQVPGEMDGQTSPVDEDTSAPNTTGPDASPDNAT